jgi:hypothetical protein
MLRIRRAERTVDAQDYVSGYNSGPRCRATFAQRHHHQTSLIARQPFASASGTATERKATPSQPRGNPAIL